MLNFCMLINISGHSKVSFSHGFARIAIQQLNEHAGGRAATYNPILIKTRNLPPPMMYFFMLINIWLHSKVSISHGFAPIATRQLNEYARGRAATYNPILNKTRDVQLPMMYSFMLINIWLHSKVSISLGFARITIRQLNEHPGGRAATYNSILNKTRDLQPPMMYFCMLINIFILVNSLFRLVLLA